MKSKSSIRILSVVVAFLSAFAAMAEDKGGSGAQARPSFGGGFDLPGVLFAPSLYQQGWRGQGAAGGFEADADGWRAFHLNTTCPGNPRVEGRVRFSDVSDGAVRGEWRVVPAADMPLLELYIGGSVPFSVFGGGTALVDGKEIELPADSTEKAHIFRDSVSTLTLRDPAGAERLRVAFDAPVRILLQDGRHWGSPVLTIRFFFEEGPVTGGHEYAIGATFKTPLAGPLAIAPNKVQRIVAGPDWIPLANEPWTEPGSALDFSEVVPHHAPAGKFGRVVAVGDHFEFADRPGVPQRFYGVNICGDANVPSTREAADRFAAQLARVGYNTLRIHHHERNIVSTNGNWRAGLDDTMPDPIRLDKFDMLVAACVEHGIYLTTDLFVSRSHLTLWRSIGIDRDGCMKNTSDFKILCAFWEPAYQNLLAWSRNFLGHVNPYTGRSLAEEPALACLALINEGNLGNYGANALRQFPCIEEAWKTWLAGHRDDEAFAGIPDTIPDNLTADNGNTPGNRHAAAFAIFLAEKEAALADRLRAFLRNELHCQAPLSSLSCWYNPVQYQLPRTGFDYVDDHFYVDHPSFLDQSWRLPSRCPNTNPMSGASAGARSVVFRRLMDKPFCLTEWNYSGPGRFRGVGGIATGVLGALQNWSGMWRFAWSHGRAGVENPETKTLGYFDMSGDPLGLAAERAALCLFLRGDMEALPVAYPVALSESALRDPRNGAPKCESQTWLWAAWNARLGTTVQPEGPADGAAAFRRPSAKVRAELETLGAGKPGNGGVLIDSKTGTFLLDTPRTAGGFAEKGRHETGAISFALEDAPATVWASSLDGAPIRSSSRILLTHLTDVQNSGIEYADANLTTLLKWGALPHIMRRGCATVSLAVEPGDWTVWRLSPGGRRLDTVPCAYENGRLGFTARTDLDPAAASYLYEIVR